MQNDELNRFILIFTFSDCRREDGISLTEW